MAKCDEGYLCEVCGNEVERLDESALYLQYVIGWVDPETLHTRRECHIRCNPSLAQYIDHKDFRPRVLFAGDLDRRNLDAEFAQERSALITRGYNRLREIQKSRSDLSVIDYPLAEVSERWRIKSEARSE